MRASDILNELWRYVEGYDKRYMVSNIGRVKAMPNEYPHLGGIRHTKEKILKPIFCKHTGYYQVSLYKRNGERRFTTIHRIVAEAFIPNPDNLPFVNHKDEVRTNNRVENLEWCTPKYNMDYSHVKDRNIDAISMPIEQYDFDGNLLHTFKSSAEAGRALKVHSSSILLCCKGKIGSVRGYLWKYKNREKTERTRARKRRVVQKDMQGNILKIWGSIKEAADGSLSSLNGILACCQGKRQKTRNLYKWEYYDKVPVTTI